MRTSGIIIGLLLAFVAGSLISFPTLSARGPEGPLVAQDAPDEAPQPDPDAERKKAAERTAKLASLTRRLHIAELKLTQTQQENQSSLQSSNEAVRIAEEELAIAEGELLQFREFDSVRRREEAALSLRSSRDRAQEAAEELAQIELMYEDQDLDDRTAEFVVSRGRRNAERAQARIEIQEAQFRSLKERELPQEEQALELALDKARTALEKAELEGKIGLQKKAIAVDEARNALEKLQSEQREKS